MSAAVEVTGLERDQLAEDGMGRRIDVGELTQAQETLLIPLWARAREAVHPEAILKDQKAVELVEQIDYTFEKFALAQTDSVGFCIRGAIIDRLVGEFLQEQPEATIVEMGVGLDTRFDRLDNGTVNWWEVDLPEAMSVRERLIERSERRRMIGSSVLAEDWIDQLEVTSPESLLFVAEGMLYFIELEELLALFGRLTQRFPGARIVFDCQSPLFLAYNNWKQPVDDAKMLWSVRRQRELKRWNEGFEVERYIGFGDTSYYQPHYLSRLPMLQRVARRLVPSVREMFKICQLQLNRL